MGISRMSVHQIIHAEGIIDEPLENISSNEISIIQGGELVIAPTRNYNDIETAWKNKRLGTQRLELRYHRFDTLSNVIHTSRSNAECNGHTWRDF